MEKPISHLTHQAITDHNAIVRNEVSRIVDELCESIPLRGKELRETKEFASKAMRAILTHSQNLADFRRRLSLNEQ